MSDSSLWYKNAIFYQIYVRAFRDSNADGHGDLPGLLEKMDYLQALGVDCIWLMPTYPSPLKDDGYDIADYFNVLDTYGTLEDFKAVVSAAHQRGIRIITDLVMNHTSDQHPWFQQARSSRDNPYRGYYVWSDTPELYKDARIIFLDTEPSNWTFDPATGQYYWHRFYAEQPDLNYDNPAVREAMKEVMRFWLDLGVDGFRADAVPYLFERDGTNCENLPETHAYLKEIRAFMDEHYPGRILLGEANQWPKDVRHYFGDDDEFQMNFHFPLMPRIFMALKQGDRTPITWVFEQTPPIPPKSQWCTFLRNHDELTLEMVTPEERQWMWEQYAPNPRMRLNLGIRRRLAPLLDNDPRKLRLANSLLFSLPGAPIIYYGDEIGMGDNIWLSDRNGVRTPMQWDPDLPNAGFSDAPSDRLYAPVIDDDTYNPAKVNVRDQMVDPSSLWHFLRRLIDLRKRLPVLADGSLEWLPARSTAVAAYLRRDERQTVLAVHNLSDAPQDVELQLPSMPESLQDLISGQDCTLQNGRLSMRLDPFQTVWLVEKNVL
ncbi:MAG TPA: maltose alpha-D-glucosyltransferase [Chloroflexi bacterium]|nr:maltose alpha-D-glucosyltransferase [Chloroflexota bacterium]